MARKRVVSQDVKTITHIEQIVTNDSVSGGEDALACFLPSAGSTRRTR